MNLNGLFNMLAKMLVRSAMDAGVNYAARRGKPEAEIGELVEAALAGSGLKTGYRASKPIIETKVWVPVARLDESRLWLLKVESALSPWLITRATLN